MSQSRAKEALQKLGLVVGSLLLCLLLLEAGLRTYASDVDLFTFRNFAITKLTLFQSAFPATYDPELGWVPKPNFESTANAWGTKVTIDENGLRETGSGATYEGRTVLTLGDSFTFGDEIDDDDTLAARLEAVMKKRVINAGVFGYGFDQTVLRGERLVQREDPEAVILQLVPEDILRVMMTIRTGVEKPFFEIVGGELVLQNVPVSPKRPSITDVGLGRAIFGYSYLVDWSMRAAKKDAWWYLGNWPQHWAYRDPDKAVQVCCRLLERFGHSLKQRRIQRVLLAEYSARASVLPKTHEYLRPINEVMGCGRKAGFAVLDLRPIHTAIARENAARHASLFVDGVGHPSRAGNELKADLIQRILTSSVASP